MTNNASGMCCEEIEEFVMGRGKTERAAGNRATVQHTPLRCLTVSLLHKHVYIRNPSMPYAFINATLVLRMMDFL